MEQAIFHLSVKVPTMHWHNVVENKIAGFVSPVYRKQLKNIYKDYASDELIRSFGWFSPHHTWFTVEDAYTCVLEDFLIWPEGSHEKHSVLMGLYDPGGRKNGILFLNNNIIKEDEEVDSFRQIEPVTGAPVDISREKGLMWGTLNYLCDELGALFNMGMDELVR